MKAVIVYESLFGNTRAVAEAIGAGVSEADPAADVAVLRVTDAGPQRVEGADLLVVGGPTHAFGMTRRSTRESGAEGGKTPEAGATVDVGVREWLETAPEAPAGARAATFDTRVEARIVQLAGGAAPKIARRLRRLGYAAAARPEVFVVEDVDGPLREGEIERARAWGAGLAHAAHPAA